MLQSRLFVPHDESGSERASAVTSDSVQSSATNAKCSLPRMVKQQSGCCCYAILTTTLLGCCSAGVLRQGEVGTPAETLLNKWWATEDWEQTCTNTFTQHCRLSEWKFFSFFGLQWWLKLLITEEMGKLSQTDNFGKPKQMMISNWNSASDAPDAILKGCFCEIMRLQQEP